MTMIEDQIISNVTCDVGKQTKISSFLKSEEMSSKPRGKLHLFFHSPLLSSRLPLLQWLIERLIYHDG